MAQPFWGIAQAELEDKTLFYFRRENCFSPSSASRGSVGAGCELPGLGGGNRSNTSGESLGRGVRAAEMATGDDSLPCLLD